MPDGHPLDWSVVDLVAGYRNGEVSPVEVARTALDRIAAHDHLVHAFVTLDEAGTMTQAAESEQRYRQGVARSLEGVPVSVKDAFHVRGLRTTLGSLVHRDDISTDDSGVVRRLRAAGAVFTGKTNTAEFGQSATTENLLGPDTGNPWDPARTAGGSSGGAAASVAAGMSVLAVGSDGGGSVRIPAAFCGLFGVKPTRGRCRDEDGFRAMTDFVSPGPLALRADDARRLLEVLADRALDRPPTTPLRIGVGLRPEGRPVDPGVAAAVERAAALLAQAGHHVEYVDLPLAGWADVFGPLVLDDEARERGHLLDRPDLLTDYERKSLEAARRLESSAVDAARAALPVYRQRISDLFLTHDVLLTPTTAVPAFTLGQRPRSIDGRPVDALWGPFPFTAPFNVAGTPAVTVPVGTVDGLPVGAQLVTPMHTDALALAIGEQLEEAIGFDRSALRHPWRLGETAVAGG